MGASAAVLAKGEPCALASCLHSYGPSGGMNMFRLEKCRSIGKTLAGVATVWTLGLGHVSAQTWQPLQTIEPGTSIQVRTSEAVDQSSMDGRVFTGVVDQ